MSNFLDWSNLVPNANYLAGRRLEYEVIDHWKEQGYDTIRASGSHGTYDIVARRLDRKPEFIQCKRVSTEAEANRLVEKFKKSTIGSQYFHQSIAIRVKGAKRLITYTV